jgi:hypothetical protein
VIFADTLSVYQAKTPHARGKETLLHAQLRWCSLLVLCAGMVFKMNDFPNPMARLAIEVIALISLVAGTVIVVGSVVWNLWRIRKSLPTEVSEELEKTFCAVQPSRTDGGCARRVMLHRRVSRPTPARALVGQTAVRRRQASFQRPRRQKGASGDGG